ncbi:MAG: MFS transporter [Acidimicrobiia bacterium]
MRRVLVALITFSVGEMANFIAILIYAYETGGPGDLGVIAFLQLGPAALLAPIGATLGDRYRREAILATAYGIFAVSSASVALALLLGWPQWPVYVLATVNAVVLTLVRPFHESLLPALARSTEQLTAGYVAGGTMENLGLIAGPLFAGLTAAAWGPGAVFAATAVLLFVGMQLVVGVDTRTATDEAVTGGALRMTLEGLAGFKSSRSRVLLLMLTSSIFLVGVLDVAIVVLAFEVFGTDDAGTAWLNASIGVGAAMGSLLAVTLIGRKHLSPPMRRGLLIAAASVALIPVAGTQAAALVALATVGIGITFVDVSGRIMLQRVIPLAGLSRAFGVLEGASMAAEGVGSVVGALLISWLGVGWALVVSGLLIVLVLVANYRSLDQADVGVVIPIEHLHLITSTPIFGALGPAKLERLAQTLDEELVSPGSPVVVQGGGRRALLSHQAGDGPCGPRRNRGRVVGNRRLLRRDSPSPRCAAHGHRRGCRRARPTRGGKGRLPGRDQVFAVPDRGGRDGVPEPSRRARFVSHTFQALPKPPCPMIRPWVGSGVVVSRLVDPGGEDEIPGDRIPGDRGNGGDDA